MKSAGRSGAPTSREWEAQQERTKKGEEQLDWEEGEPARNVAREEGAPGQEEGRAKVAEGERERIRRRGEGVLALAEEAAARKKAAEEHASVERERERRAFRSKEAVGHGSEEGAWPDWEESK